MTTFKQSLYRTYRPSNFEEVRGQDHIVTSLKQAIKAGSLPHAFLFHGSRGLGKTTLARILAHEIGVDPVDLYEIDGASKRKVEDVEDLQGLFSTKPMTSDKKVIIIDEVHMMSKHAFNALLKTIEEPPEHLIFMFATTEYDKVPDTIVSRCQVLSLRKPSLAVLQEYIADIAEQEGYALDDGVPEMVAIAADGSFRDALGYLQSVLSSCTDKTVSADIAKQVTRVPDTETVLNVLESVASGDVAPALRILKEAEVHHIDPNLLIQQLIKGVRTVLRLRFDTSSTSTITESMSDDMAARFKALSTIEGKAVNASLLEEFLNVVPLVHATSTGYAAIVMVLYSIAERSNT